MVNEAENTKLILRIWCTEEQYQSKIRLDVHRKGDTDIKIVASWVNKGHVSFISEFNGEPIATTLRALEHIEKEFWGVKLDVTIEYKKKNE